MNTTIQTEMPAALLKQAELFVSHGWAGNMQELLAESLRRYLESHQEACSNKPYRTTSSGDCMGMTEAAWRIVVADAGPLIHLDELDSLDLLDFGEVLVPDAVWTEVTRHRPAALASPRVQLSRQSDIVASPRVQSLTPVFGLHQGEREALSLCLARPGAMLLTDDAAARLAADSLGIVAHGTLGLILRSVRRELRST